MWTQVSTREFVWILSYLYVDIFFGSYNNTSSVKQSDWIIITWIYKKTRFGGEQVKLINKDTRLDNKKLHKRFGQVNGTNIQDNWTSQHKYNGWHYKMVQYKWASKQKQLCEQYVSMWLCVQLYAILDVMISVISVNNKWVQINKGVRVTG